MDSHMDLLGELASDAALERQDFIVQATEQLRKFLDHHRERIARPRRADADRRGARLPVDRARPHVPQPQPVPRRRRPASGSARPRSSSPPPSWSSSTTRPTSSRPSPRPRARRPACRAEPTAEGDILETAGIAPEETVSLGEDPYAAAADSWAAGQPASLDGGRRGVGSAAAVRPRARVPGAKPAQRGAPARGVRGRGRRAERQSSAT